MVGKNSLMKVDKDFEKLVRDMSNKNEMPMTEITREIAKVMRTMNGKKTTREIKF